MLFIYYALPVGGIETFFLRMAKERKAKGLITKILLFSNENQSNNALLNEIKLYSEVYFFNDFYFFPEIVSKIFLLTSPLKKFKVNEMMRSIEHIHVSSGLHALVGNRLIKIVGRNLKLSVGFYHSEEFFWSAKKKLPYFERINRFFILYDMPRSNLFLFSNSIINFYIKRHGMDLTGAQTFRLGVIERESHLNFNKNYSKNTSTLKICSIGRLVDFKTYNLWMIDVVNNLIIKGYDVTYDIYGDGELFKEIKMKIDRLNLSDNIKLKGTLPYSKFNEVVCNYDIFVGSGTSIIQASSCGVCSIIGIESMEEPETYGFFCEYSCIDYNVEHSNLKKLSVIDIIEKFIYMEVSEKNKLSKAHIDAVEEFYMDSCNKNFDHSGVVKIQAFKHANNYFYYELSRLYEEIKSKISKNSSLRNKYFLKKNS